ncbi:YbaB/EbfC family nucleoid-associated protein [Nocardia puris]|uniref:YbaB/EbfC DNA-binding family protein n=1 Tax=Nocardia puris TaxID=208602 RepID=A0A366D5F0_9NOCA|nr:YbaB/EbfC family nucleoid-associated protein [Nocardia puris]RBO85263.1 YbaB/EbfC DNA-binding family protein [Nocardia puris]
MTDATDAALTELLARQRQLMEQAKVRIQAVEAEAETTDRLVRVRVNASGALLDVTLGPGTERLSRNQLGEMITRTAQRATRRAADRVAAELDELDTAQQRLLEIIESINPSTASIVRPAPHYPQVRQNPGDHDAAQPF